eukprot:350660-Chlamydomonas_euryale.AAC.7
MAHESQYKAWRMRASTKNQNDREASTPACVHTCMGAVHPDPLPRPACCSYHTLFVPHVMVPMTKGLAAGTMPVACCQCEDVACGRWPR